MEAIEHQRGLVIIELMGTEVIVVDCSEYVMSDSAFDSAEPPGIVVSRFCGTEVSLNNVFEPSVGVRSTCGIFKAFDGEAFEREGKDFRLVNELDGEEVGCVVIVDDRELRGRVLDTSEGTEEGGSSCFDVTFW